MAIFDSSYTSVNLTVNVFIVSTYLLAIATINELSIPPLKKAPTSISEDNSLSFTLLLRIESNSTIASWWEIVSGDLYWSIILKYWKCNLKVINNGDQRVQ